MTLPRKKPKIEKHSNYAHMAKLCVNSRKKIGMTQLTLATLMGYAQGQIVSNIERGMQSVPVKSWKTFSDALGIPLVLVKETWLMDRAAWEKFEIGRLIVKRQRKRKEY